MERHFAPLIVTDCSQLRGMAVLGHTHFCPYSLDKPHGASHSNTYKNGVHDHGEGIHFVRSCYVMYSFTSKL